MNNCDHAGPRHLIDKFDNGHPESFWMCPKCGEIVGRYKRIRTTGANFDVDTHTWTKPNGQIISEYAPL